MMSNMSSRLPPSIPNTTHTSTSSSQIPESECMKIQVDLMEQRAHLVSPKPVRIKLIWLKDGSDQGIDGKVDRAKKNTFYERMFKIDTRIKGNFYN